MLRPRDFFEHAHQCWANLFIVEEIVCLVYNQNERCAVRVAIGAHLTDFLNIGDLLNYDLMRGTIVTLDSATDTCTVSVGGSVVTALLFYH